MDDPNKGEQKPGAGDGTNSELGEGLTPEELNQEIEVKDEDLDGLDDDTSKKIKTAVAQKKHWRTKHEKEHEEFEAYKKAHPDTTPEPKPKPQEKKEDKKKDDEVNNRLIFLELKDANPDLSLDRESADEAIALAKVRGVTPQEIISSSFFQSYLKEKSEKKKAEGGTPDPSHRSGQPQEDWDRYIREPSLIKSLKADPKKFAKFKEYLAAHPEKVPKE